jgi:hypothetical protein
MDLKLSELNQKVSPSIGDELLIFNSETKCSEKITVANLLGLALNHPCEYCGSRGHYDIRGNCGACGAPVVKTKSEQQSEK